jgi:hypothetical protein
MKTIEGEEMVMFGEAEQQRSSGAQVVGGLARGGRSVLAWLSPELSLLGGVSRRFRFLLLGGSALFIATIAVAVSWQNAVNEKTTRHSATRFAAAVVHNDPGSAPPGAAPYVRGVRAYFGPVTGARFLADHDKGINTGDESDTQSYFVAELLLHTRRGPAVIELAFDNHAINSDRVSGVYELRPNDAPALSPTERKQVAAAFAARGGRPADEVGLSSASEGSPPPPVIAALSASRAFTRSMLPTVDAGSRLGAAAKQLSCIQEARGDVTKLQKCAQS